MCQIPPGAVNRKVKRREWPGSQSRGIKHFSPLVVPHVTSFKTPKSKTENWELLADMKVGGPGFLMPGFPSSLGFHRKPRIQVTLKLSTWTEGTPWSFLDA